MRRNALFALETRNLIRTVKPIHHLVGSFRAADRAMSCGIYFRSRWSVKNRKHEAVLLFEIPRPRLVISIGDQNPLESVCPSNVGDIAFLGQLVS
jgi:hypothetical protein